MAENRNKQNKNRNEQMRLLCHNSLIIFVPPKLTVEFYMEITGLGQAWDGYGHNNGCISRCRTLEGVLSVLRAIML